MPGLPREARLILLLILLRSLGEMGRICVISHELAHLRSNHYFSKIGDIYTYFCSNVCSRRICTRTWLFRLMLVNPAITNSFGRQFELSADELAVAYIKKTGLTKADYVKFLYWMKKNLDSSGSFYNNLHFLNSPCYTRKNK